MGIGRIGRRGLVASVAALVGAGLSRLANPDTAHAATMVTDANNTSISDTAITNSGNGAGQILAIDSPAFAIFASRVTSSSTVGRFGVLGKINGGPISLDSHTSTAGLWGINNGGGDVAHGVKGQTAGYGAGVYGDGQANGIGLWGDSTSRVGVFGTCTTGIGIFGVSKASAPNATVAPPLIAGVGGQGFARIGVYGLSDSSTGVHGESTSAAGVFGTSTSAFGVQGASQNAYGVSGNSTTQAGVWGSSNSNVGVLGSSTAGVGVNGISVSSNGVNGLSTSGIGVYGSSPGGQAGRFDGDVVIIGNLTVSGNFPHTAAVPSSDGTLRRMYSPQSAEAYYEDFGQGSLTNGVGRVALDADFAALVMSDTYHVFLTARGDCRGLFISSQDTSGFEVREMQSGTSSIGFSYRLMARPRNTPSTRLDRVNIPPAPAQPKLDRVEPLDVPATLRELHHNDGPQPQQPSTPAGSSVRDGR
jgi:hypothetical protein